MLLISLTALAGALAYFNTWWQHGSNRTKIRFDMYFGDDAKSLYGFLKGVHVVLGFFLLASFLLLLVLTGFAKLWYLPVQELIFPLVTVCITGSAIFLDVRFCVKHKWNKRQRVKDIFNSVYGRSLDWDPSTGELKEPE
jgi:hypothetical protein